MPQKTINWFGAECTLACDGRCDKAWGHTGRPKFYFDPKEPDDYESLADDELGTAPASTGTWEGGHGKPSAVPLREDEGHRMNKWCSRACERSTIAEPGEPIRLPDLSKRWFNMPWKRLASSLEHCICAAIVLRDGAIVRGRRHDDCIRAAKKWIDHRHSTGVAPAPWSPEMCREQGFVTSTGRYVDREEGLRLQLAAGIPSARPSGYRKRELFSEDLY